MDFARVSAQRACRILQGNNLYDPGWHFGFNWPAFIIVMLLTVVLVRGIRESADANNVMVLLKIVAILLFVGFGIRLIHPANWHPFSPNGWPGILTGGSIIFFTYIGFDSVSTAAEECKDPQRDLPRRNYCDAGDLHRALHRRGRGAHRPGPAGKRCGMTPRRW